jgi:hypothetical protein
LRPEGDDDSHLTVHQFRRELAEAIEPPSVETFSKAMVGVAKLAQPLLDFRRRAIPHRQKADPRDVRCRPLRARD